jgi:hypothetical protein
MGRIALDDVYLFMVFLGAVAFCLWEGYALLPGTVTHTISYWAHQYFWVKVLIGIGLPIAFGAWFLVHASKDIPK